MFCMSKIYSKTSPLHRQYTETAWHNTSTSLPFVLDSTEATRQQRLPPSRRMPLLRRRKITTALTHTTLTVWRPWSASFSICTAEPVMSSWCGLPAELDGSWSICCWWQQFAALEHFCYCTGTSWWIIMVFIIPSVCKTCRADLIHRPRTLHTWLWRQDQAM